MTSPTKANRSKKFKALALASMLAGINPVAVFAQATSENTTSTNLVKTLSPLSYTPSVTPADTQAPPMTLITPADNTPGYQGGQKTEATKSEPSNPTGNASPAVSIDSEIEPPPAEQVVAPAVAENQESTQEPAREIVKESDRELAKESAKEISSESTPSVMDSENVSTESNAESIGEDGKQLAQGARPESLKRPRTGQSPGEVQIKRPFKLFAREEIIHNLSFRDTPVREVIAEIARRGNLNILIDRSVVGKITGDLHDLTLNEAMTNVLSGAGLQTRILPGNTVMIATQNAFTVLGMNRTAAKMFHLSYAYPYDVAQILHASIFNRGFLPDFQSAVVRKTANTGFDKVGRSAKEVSGSKMRVPGEFGGDKAIDQVETKTTDSAGNEADDTTTETKYTSKLDNARSVKSQTKATPTEGQGYQNEATDPGSMQIRSMPEVAVDYQVEQNGGGTICIPDSKNRQVLVVGTQEDLQLAEEAIYLLDRRPKEVHIQASLLEITNEGIREIGATMNLQGQGASANILGSQPSPLVQFLPGLGSPGPISGPTGYTIGGTTTTTGPLNYLSRLGNSTLNGLIQTPAQIFSALAANPLTTFASPPVGSTVGMQVNNLKTQPNDVTPTSVASAFTGLIGNLVPTVLPSAAAVQARARSFSSFNFLTLSKGAGGRANIATMPAGLNLGVNLLLQTNKAKLVANPSVVVTDNTEALIVIADEVVHKVTTTVSLGVVTTNVELEKAGIFLDVVPKVSDDGFITMRLRPRVSTPLPQQSFADDTVVVTPLNIREVLSQNVRVKDGQTLVIGGLFSEREEARLGKVPFLAETPIFGTFFRNTLKGRHRNELMLMITPKVVEEEPPTLVEGNDQKVM